MNKKRNEALQELCRDYLGRLRYMAKKHGLDGFVRDTIRANRRGECAATEHEVMLLSRCVDDERVLCTDVPKIIGKSYRECHKLGVFGRIKKLKHVGIYSKVGAILLGEELKSLYND